MRPHGVRNGRTTLQVTTRPSGVSHEQEIHQHTTICQLADTPTSSTLMDIWTQSHDGPATYAPTNRDAAMDVSVAEKLAQPRSTHTSPTPKRVATPSSNAFSSRPERASGLGGCSSEPPASPSPRCLRNWRTLPRSATRTSADAAASSSTTPPQHTNRTSTGSHTSKSMSKTTDFRKRRPQPWHRRKQKLLNRRKQAHSSLPLQQGLVNSISASRAMRRDAGDFFQTVPRANHQRRLLVPDDCAQLLLVADERGRYGASASTASCPDLSATMAAFLLTRNACASAASSHSPCASTGSARASEQPRSPYRHLPLHLNNLRLHVAHCQHLARNRCNVVSDFAMPDRTAPHLRHHDGRQVSVHQSC